MNKTVILWIVMAITLFLGGCKSQAGGKNSGSSGTITAGEVADITFNEYEHDFGRVTEGEKVAYVFPFQNNGPGNLVIKSAVTSCGCTVTKYDRKPIPPGKGGSLEVAFDTSGRNGTQSKTISVTSNSKVPVVILKITAEVISE